MRNIVLLAVLAGVLTGCHTTSNRDYVSAMNADKRIWPPVVEGQPWPPQMIDKK